MQRGNEGGMEGGDHHFDIIGQELGMGRHFGEVWFNQRSFSTSCYAIKQNQKMFASAVSDSMKHNLKTEQRNTRESLSFVPIHSLTTQIAGLDAQITEMSTSSPGASVTY